MEKIRVLIAEDHTIVRKGLRALLDDEGDIQVVGEAEDGHQAIQQTEKKRPDVVVMDITMPVLNGLEATRQIKEQFPGIKILILTVHTTEEYIFQILKTGASGYLVKQAAPEELVFAIRAVFRGNSFLSPVISQKIIDEYILNTKNTNKKDTYETLTRRERQVLQLIAEGHPNREIADLLHISVKTVETHRAHILEKLNLHSTAELTKYALRKKIINNSQ